MTSQSTPQPAGGSDAGQAAGIVPSIIWGIVEPDGTINTGSGFSVSVTGTGSYTITFDTPFSATPAYALTPGGTSGPLFTPSLWVNSSDLTVSYADAQGNPTDTWFSLIVMGPA